MRQFIVLGHEATTDPDFTLKDMPGDAGRLDVLARCVNAAFMLSHGLRDDVRLHLVLQDRYTIRVEGDEVKYLNPDEWSTGSLIKKALQKKEVKDASEELRSTPGIYIREEGFEDVLTRVRDKTIIQLHEDGTSVADAAVPDDPVFVLSDHREFTDSEQRLLEEHADQQICLGPHALHGDHAMVIAHNWLDTDGYSTY